MKGIKTCSCPNPICSEPTGELAFNIKTCGARSEVTVLREPWVKEPRNASDSAQDCPNGVLGIGEIECLELVKWSAWNW